MTNAWHFRASSGLLRDGTEPPPIGTPHIHEGELELYSSGLHASLSPLDALAYAPGAQVVRVRCGGEVIYSIDKLVCSERTDLWHADATKTLHEFAVWCARCALARIDDPDPRGVEALDMKEQWLRGEATDLELRFARDAAWSASAAARSAAARDAAWDAAWDAAKSAAWSATKSAAWAAAGDTAWDTAWDAAWSAAKSAAKSAAWAAARDAAWDAARDAERKAQRTELTRRLNLLAPKGIQ